MLDPYETRALALRTTVLQRIRAEGAPDDPLLLRIISARACIPESAGDRVAVVAADVMAGLRLSPQERQQTHTAVAGVAQAFDPEIRHFTDGLLEAVQHGAPRDTRAAWRADVQGLIELFEEGTKEPPGTPIDRREAQTDARMRSWQEGKTWRLAGAMLYLHPLKTPQKPHPPWTPHACVCDAHLLWW